MADRRKKQPGSKRAKRLRRSRWRPCCWYCQPGDRRQALRERDDRRQMTGM